MSEYGAQPLSQPGLPPGVLGPLPGALHSDTQPLVYTPRCWETPGALSCLGLSLLCPLWVPFTLCPRSS